MGDFGVRKTFCSIPGMFWTTHCMLALYIVHKIVCIMKYEVLNRLKILWHCLSVEPSIVIRKQPFKSSSLINVIQTQSFSIGWLLSNKYDRHIHPACPDCQKNWHLHRAFENLERKYLEGDLARPAGVLPNVRDNQHNLQIRSQPRWNCKTLFRKSVRLLWTLYQFHTTGLHPGLLRDSGKTCLLYTSDAADE